MANSPARLFVDMDGTLAVFNPVDTLETLYQPGYFSNLEPQDNVVQAVKSIITTRPEIEVYILSAVLTDSAYAQDEKNEWLDRYLPEVDSAHRIFPPCGADKKDYIRGGVRDTDFLLDDYTQNLTLWHPPGQGIKLLNGINHTRGTWEYDRIRCDKLPEDLATNLISVINGVSTVMDEKPEITRDDVLNELQNQAWNNVLAYSENYAMTIARAGQEDLWKEATTKAAIIDQLVQEVTQQPIGERIPQKITRDSQNIHVAGHFDTWYCIDSTIIGNVEYFLMENEEYGDMADCVILDRDGNLIMDDVWNGFDDLKDYLEDRDISSNEFQQDSAGVSEEREEELEEYFWNESNDPETQEWRDELTAAESALVDQWDARVSQGMGNLAKETLRVISRNEQTTLDRDFLCSAGDAYAIFQIKDGAEFRDIRFESMSRVQSIDSSVVRDNYNLIYSAPLTMTGSTPSKLNTIYEKFNIDHPSDFKGHSLSVSDIVALKQNGVVSCHYVDSVGFQKLPNFLYRDVSDYTKVWQDSVKTEITNIMNALNMSYQAMGRGDSWGFGFGRAPDDPSLFNSLYSGGNEYEGSFDELRDYANKLYERHFGVAFDPAVPPPDQAAPFYGKVEYLNSQGIIGETIFYTKEEKYLQACNDKYEYGVPLRGSRLTEVEYNEAIAAIKTAEAGRQNIIEEVEYEYGGED